MVAKVRIIFKTAKKNLLKLAKERCDNLAVPLNF